MSNSDTAAFYAQAFNQYKRALGTGYGDTREAAIAEAKIKANTEIKTTNPNWKWRIASVRVQSNPFKNENK